MHSLLTLFEWFLIISRDDCSGLDFIGLLVYFLFFVYGGTVVVACASVTCILLNLLTYLIFSQCLRLHVPVSMHVCDKSRSYSVWAQPKMGLLPTLGRLALISIDFHGVECCSVQCAIRQVRFSLLTAWHHSFSQTPCYVRSKVSRQNDCNLEISDLRLIKTTSVTIISLWLPLVVTFTQRRYDTADKWKRYCVIAMPSPVISRLHGRINQSSFSLMTSIVIMLSFALLVMLASAKLWSFYSKNALQNTQSDCHQWLSHSFRVHQIRFRPGLI